MGGGGTRLDLTHNLPNPSGPWYVTDRNFPSPPRLLVPLTTRFALAALAPDFDGLRAACDRLGFLGCYVYSVPEPTGRAAARMFALSIGVPEDIANANSTAGLAAHLAGQGTTRIAVDMGDSLGSLATFTATTQPGPAGPLIHLGGTARLIRVVRLPGLEPTAGYRLLARTTG
ncbi:PhzF family phenazine biosynthesis protein [Streptomyces sp. NBC_01799]|nr:PhzF family phenazine biosynthesis protein [Streptomyces sp. NBC_01800]WSA82563.1 PhzF family phenazine biosynthesis protein [Streptomyces sp. NBC_01799]